MEEFLWAILLSKLEMIFLDKLNSPITEQEIKNAISSLKPPGPEGFTAEIL